MNTTVLATKTDYKDDAWMRDGQPQEHQDDVLSLIGYCGFKMIDCSDDLWKNDPHTLVLAIPSPINQPYLEKKFVPSLIKAVTNLRPCECDVSTLAGLEGYEYAVRFFWATAP